MITFALVLAGLLLAFSAFTVVGVPYLVMGPRAFEVFGQPLDLQDL
jgi:hypothetical protein